MFSAVLSKLEEDWFSRQSISRTPRLKVRSARSKRPSSGVVDPSPRACHRTRRSRTRPLAVSTLIGCRPL
jgi:hypothetical protein